MKLPYSIAAKLKMNGLRLTLMEQPAYLYKQRKRPYQSNNLTQRLGAVTESSGMPYIRSFGFSVNEAFKMYQTRLKKK